jgi:hypothetical protein
MMMNEIDIALAFPDPSENETLQNPAFINNIMQWARHLIN